ncbi:MAG: methyltransferase domain-containing protein [Zoogloeaceae bacterium]|jgi:2-polyprenyl-3-methyl-5-hydroxy-6-metoxy-1,4-benzoquinol methylase|nr:methyltransferase domain-containing protein [Zoogloeaceae bacterium]
MNAYSNSAPQVADELEQLVLREIVLRVRSNMPTRVLDLRCGEGRRSVSMAELGATVLAADAPELSNPVKNRALAASVGDSVQFTPIKTLPEDLPPGPFDLAFCHHGISFLPYAAAHQTLHAALKSLRIGGKLFISAYGLHSALGENYADASAPIERRFCKLTLALAKSYNIPDPVCLYSERNLVTLLFEIGGSVLRSFTTTHGTIKAVAVRL